ncbi:MAG: choice-of-anchor J domain-containing protein [Candidatus Cloacimonas sp.]
MKSQVHKLLLLLMLSAITLVAYATVNEYSFESILGTFTEISGGTTHGTSANDNECFLAIPLGFTFTYNGVDYTTISIASNGFIAMGDTVATSTVPISSGTSTNNVIAVLSRDLKSRAGGTLMSLSSGTAPNRVFTIQWKNWRRSPTTAANDDFTFQIQLQENDNKVVFVYGPFTAVTASTAATVQVGLRGDSNADFNNRTTTTDWSATIAGTANNGNCTLSASVFPANGLTFTFTPPVTGEPPLAAQNPHPANGAINVPIGSNLTWITGGGIVDGYKVYFGTDNPPTNIASGVIQTATVFDPANDLSYNTTYYWKIVPFNQFGDAGDCPVWSFTVLADPTVTTYPYEQNFDLVTVPDLPLGWTVINANNDAYTWQSYNANGQTTPNSMRIRYNTTLAMDDWLMSPPLVFTDTHNYKIKFYYCGGGSNYVEKLSVYWGTTPTAAGLTNLLWQNLNITNTAYETAEIVLPSVTGGTYYIGFHGHSDADKFYIYLDTFSVTDIVEQLNPPQNLTATIQDYYNVHLTWQAPVANMAYTEGGNRELFGYKVYRNQTLINTINSASTLVYDDTNLTVGTYSYTVTAFYTTGESVPAGPVSVTIVAPLLPPTNLTATVDGNDVTLNWGNPEPPPPGQWITWCNDVLGNSIGTNSVANFDVAHRWHVADLASYVGDTITQVKFVPAEANCVYTVKIWTGGSATNAGTLVYSQQIQNPVIDSWNVHALTTPVTIPANSEVWVGFNCNTQAGYPAGCDNGPQVEGKGNMMYFQGAWSTLSTINASLTYNWLIQTFVENSATLKKMELKPIADFHPSVRSSGELALLHKNIDTLNQRAITGYKVYRDGTLINTISDPDVTTYADIDLANGTYTYGVSSVYSTGESVPATVQAIVNVQLATAFFTDDFEGYPDFATVFAPWTLLDADLSTTYGFSEIEFPGSEGPMAYIVFNPASTVPPVTTIIPHSGTKMVASFAATTPPNNDWLITPRVNLGTNAALKFYAKSHTAQYGMERFRIGVSTLPQINPQSFQYITGNDYVEVPANWTEYIYDLSAYDNQNVYIGIRCVSNDAFIFFVDDVSIHGEGGHIVSNEDELASMVRTELKGNYPNPFNPETTIFYSVKDHTPVTIDVYNLKGQKVTTLVNETKAPGDYSVVWKGLDENNRPVSSGVYFFKMNAGKYSSTKKMIMMK